MPGYPLRRRPVEHVYMQHYNADPLFVDPVKWEAGLQLFREDLLRHGAIDRADTVAWTTVERTIRYRMRGARGEFIAQAVDNLYRNLWTNYDEWLKGKFPV